ncbi:hypothetical protein DFJ58DRAFT_777329 [Suillus subalutaceus]|uniref:uncharacterized protein n=1 Tax=Suillus subalutaceus TaxID=48586 RepID=UPI001B86D6B1|nr:uncharacterized protein DFJ58DRAFT_777329 [Suillus subalutaceus]KAG1861556.1 hypothetical protein DFJ58DRAFT_777329 [Suillus subalutaceus]
MPWSIFQGSSRSSPVYGCILGPRLVIGHVLMIFRSIARHHAHQEPRLTQYRHSLLFFFHDACLVVIFVSHSYWDY